MNNDDDLLIRPKPIIDARDAMRAHVKRISDIIDDFKIDMNGVASKWTGEASAAWAERQESINSEVLRMNLVLNQVGDQVVATSDAHGRNDRRAADEFRMA